MSEDGDGDIVDCLNNEFGPVVVTSDVVVISLCSCCSLELATNQTELLQLSLDLKLRHIGNDALLLVATIL
ncbi:hypothetical protein SAMD00019534_077680 [Acytostelium subglobosum LB1]|uniref:hypothetical protein n=1 Tax=Acytostelium subglobosum LB1 TaxID=1410327 RepID=UPI000644DE95|nr:hypothetical protein SAMD00019534_077680 [Acytostelium subglobosum LB1]GAM24593.1 hypothetical protein SAMD00019534_077680 [Acytostelium subglobosum LB1]|eukprot:XP_012752262.1 hypothetical protein SAMD00019534_077680 [Acytostelium subglobosum LB1]